MPAKARSAADLFGASATACPLLEVLVYGTEARNPRQCMAVP